MAGDGGRGGQKGAESDVGGAKQGGRKGCLVRNQVEQAVAKKSASKPKKKKRKNSNKQ